jgi:hypothetical protein
MRKVGRFVVACAVALAGMGVVALPAAGKDKAPKGKRPNAARPKKFDPRKHRVQPVNTANLTQAATLLGQAVGKARMNPWVFGGHRAKAVTHMLVAQAEIQKAFQHLKAHPPHQPRPSLGPGPAPNLSLPPGDWAKQYPNLVQALQLLGTAVPKAHANPPVFGGHRARAVSQMRVAIGEIHRAFRYVNNHPPNQVNYPNVVAAIRLLTQADAKAQANPSVFGGHRAKAIARMELAFKEFQRGIQHVKAHPPRRSDRRRGAVNVPPVTLPPGDWRGQYPNLFLALQALRQAEAKAHANPPVFGGHVHQAEIHMYVAINEIHRAFHYVHKHPPEK